ncbi:MAG: tRNA (adenine(22)-N(1))-methyltransferase TrmK, partial [Bacilli bacterium]|nr:tRNA (adenine(22)-N(1))-methyltransferase TrmK [Bacilli bacterium]
NAIYSFNDLYFGKILIDKKSDIFKEKWENKYKRYKNIKAFSEDEEKMMIMKGIEEILCK